MSFNKNTNLRMTVEEAMLHIHIGSHTKDEAIIVLKDEVRRLRAVTGSWEVTEVALFGRQKDEPALAMISRTEAGTWVTSYAGHVPASFPTLEEAKISVLRDLRALRDRLSVVDE